VSGLLVETARSAIRVAASARLFKPGLASYRDRQRTCGLIVQGCRIWVDYAGMEASPAGRSSALGGSSHFSCSMTSLLVERVREFGGAAAVCEMLGMAGSRRTAAYLVDLANWVSYEEAVALWRAGARVTQHPQFARAVGEDAARHLNASPVAALFRSLGSPENVYRQIATSASKYSVVTTLEAVEVGPGFAKIVAVPVDGFARDADHCA
jgi:hypothetical protein